MALRLGLGHNILVICNGIVKLLINGCKVMYNEMLIALRIKLRCVLIFSIKHGTSPDGKPCTIIVTTKDHLKVFLSWDFCIYGLCMLLSWAWSVNGDIFKFQLLQSYYTLTIIFIIHLNIQLFIIIKNKEEEDFLYNLSTLWLLLSSRRE